jgi:hypothetical protein
MIPYQRFIESLVVYKIIFIKAKRGSFFTKPHRIIIAKWQVELKTGQLDLTINLK